MGRLPPGGPGWGGFHLEVLVREVSTWRSWLGRFPPGGPGWGGFHLEVLVREVSTWRSWLGRFPPVKLIVCHNNQTSRYPMVALSLGLPLLWDGRGRPGKTYHLTDVTDCGQFRRTPKHSEHANMGLPKLVHLHYTQGGYLTSAAVQMLLQGANLVHHF